VNWRTAALRIMMAFSSILNPPSSSIAYTAGVQTARERKEEEMQARKEYISSPC